MHTVPFISFSHFFNQLGIKGTIKLNIIAARDLKSVDTNGLSDPYIKVVCKYHGKSTTVFQTTVQKKTLNPTWDVKTELIFPPTLIRFVVKDYNMLGDSKDMGEVEFDIAHYVESLKQKDNILIDKWFPIILGGSGELHLKIEIQINQDVLASLHSIEKLNDGDNVSVSGKMKKSISKLFHQR